MPRTCWMSLAGRWFRPGEVLVVGGAHRGGGGNTSYRPAGAEVIDLCGRTLLSSMIDVHVHLFLHPGAEDLQTVEESVGCRG